MDLGRATWLYFLPLHFVVSNGVSDAGPECWNTLNSASLFIAKLPVSWSLIEILLSYKVLGAGKRKKENMSWQRVLVRTRLQTILTKRNMHVEYSIESTRVRLAYQRDAKTNSYLNTAQSTFHVVLSLVYKYTYRKIILSAFYFKDFQSAKMINLLLHIVKWLERKRRLCAWRRRLKPISIKIRTRVRIWGTGADLG